MMNKKMGKTTKVSSDLLLLLESSLLRFVVPIKILIIATLIISNNLKSSLHRKNRLPFTSLLVVAVLQFLMFFVFLRKYSQLRFWEVVSLILRSRFWVYETPTSFLSFQDLLVLFLLRVKIFTEILQQKNQQINNKYLC